MDAKALIEKIGLSEIASAVGVKENTVRISLYQGRGKLPPAWFAACEELARHRGIDCPRGAFNFKTASQDTAA